MKGASYPKRTTGARAMHDQVIRGGTIIAGSGGTPLTDDVVSGDGLIVDSDKRPQLMQSIRVFLRYLFLLILLTDVAACGTSQRGNSIGASKRDSDVVLSQDQRNDSVLDDSDLVNSNEPISDQQIVIASKRHFDATKLLDQRKILGKHNGALVVADYPCGDICPDYTSRHIHYDVQVGPECDAVGGVEQLEGVSVAAANEAAAFCIPKVLKRQVAK